MVGAVVVGAVVVGAVVVVACVVVGVDSVVAGDVSSGARATLSRTFVPDLTEVLGAGFCARTVPAGLSEGTGTRFASRPASRSVAVASEEVVPTTSGTSTGLRPFETVSATEEPSFRLPPAVGSCSTTVPACLSEKTSVTLA